MMERKALNNSTQISDNNYNKVIFEYARNITIPKNSPVWKYAEMYNTNALLYTLIDFKALKVSQAKPMIYKPKNKGLEKEFRKWNGKQSDYYSQKKFNQLKEAAVEEIYINDLSDIGEMRRLKKLLTRPNEWQRFNEFLYSLSAFQDISGWSLMYGAKDSLKGQYVNLYSIPTHQTEIKGGTQFEGITGYVFDGDYKQAFLAEDCVAMRTFSTKFDRHGSHLYGQSKVKAAYSELMTYISAREREYTAFETGDSVNVATPKNADQVPSGADNDTFWQNLKDKFFKSIRQKDKHSTAFFGFPIDVVNIASTLDKSKTIEAKQEIKEILSSIFHISDRVVFNSSTSASYNNLKEDTKTSLRNGVFPFLNQFEETFHEMVIKPQFGVDFAIDYDCYEELNPDVVTEMGKFKDMPFLSDNEIREWFNFAPLKDPKADIPEKYWEDVIQPLDLNVDGGY